MENVNEIDDFGRSILMNAVSRIEPNINFIIKLIDAGADINYVNIFIDSSIMRCYNATQLLQGLFSQISQEVEVTLCS